MATETDQIRTGLKLVPLLVLSLLAGCASAGGTMRAGDAVASGAVDKPAAAEDVDMTPSSGSVPAANAAASAAPAPRNGAAVALQSQAAAASRAGDFEQAAATLERAVRIAPDDAELWLALARLRLQQGQNQQAFELARRAQSFAPPGSAALAQALDLQQQAGMGNKR